MLLESATLGSVGQFLGLTVWGQQFLGWRFNLASTSTITKVGGHIRADFTGNGLFAAIIKLTPPNFLPSFAPHAIESSPDTVAHTLIVPTSPSSDVLVSLSVPVVLPPGNYGLVFGGADSAIATSPYYPFGATGTGVMPTDNTDLPGSSYFFGDAFRWSNVGAQAGMRFVIEAEPEYRATFKYLYAAIDPMALILSTDAYLKWVEIHHPREPALPKVAEVVKSLNADEKKVALARAKVLIAYGKAVVEGLSGKQ